MRRTRGLALMVALAAVPLSARARGSYHLRLATEPPQSDEEAIRRLVDDSTAAWNRGDAAGYAGRVTVDAFATDITGASLTGRRNFEARQAELLRTIFKGSRLTQTVRQLRLIKDDVAMVEIDTELTAYAVLPPGVKALSDRVLRTRLQEVLVKISGAWFIDGYHNVDVKVPGLGGDLRNGPSCAAALRLWPGRRPPSQL